MLGEGIRVGNKQSLYLAIKQKISPKLFHSKNKQFVFTVFFGFANLGEHAVGGLERYGPRLISTSTRLAHHLSKTMSYLVLLNAIYTTPTSCTNYYQKTRRFAGGRRGLRRTRGRVPRRAVVNRLPAALPTAARGLARRTAGLPTLRATPATLYLPCTDLLDHVKNTSTAIIRFYPP